MRLDLLGKAEILGENFLSFTIILLISREESGLESISEAGVRLEATDKFRRDIKKHPLDEINNALRRIGTGGAHEHNLSERGKGYRTINVGRSGRILYQKEGDRATLIGYNASHNYEKMLRRK